MGWGNNKRRRGAAPRHYNLPPPSPGLLIRQSGITYGDGRPDAERDTIPTHVRVYSLEGEPLEETTVDLPPGKQDEPIAVRVDRPSSSPTILERGVHIPERGCLWHNSAASACGELRMIPCPSAATSSSPALTGNGTKSPSTTRPPASPYRTSKERGTWPSTLTTLLSTPCSRMLN